MYLVDVRIELDFQVATASPGFGSREASYLPFPGEPVGERETMKLTYVSLTERADVDIVDLVAARRETDT